MKKACLVLLTLLLSALTPIVAPAQAQAARSSALTLDVSSTRPDPGTRIRFSGTRARGVTSVIRLQQRVGGTWKKVARTKASHQSFRLRVKAPAGAATYRVLASDRKGRRITSRPVTIKPRVQDSAPAAEDDSELARVRAQILSEVNAYRADEKLKPLKETSAMDAVAQDWSVQMASEQEMYHNPDFSQQIPKGWTRAGENIAAGFEYDEVTTAWYNSPGHRANMLGDYTHIGIGYGYADDGRAYFTQDFGKY